MKSVTLPTKQTELGSPKGEKWAINHFDNLNYIGAKELEQVYGGDIEAYHKQLGKRATHEIARMLMDKGGVQIHHEYDVARGGYVTAFRCKWLIEENENASV